MDCKRSGVTLQRYKYSAISRFILYIFLALKNNVFGKPEEQRKSLLLLCLGENVFDKPRTETKFTLALSRRENDWYNRKRLNLFEHFSTCENRSAHYPTS